MSYDKLVVSYGKKLLPYDVYGNFLSHTCYRITPFNDFGRTYGLPYV